MKFSDFADYIKLEHTVFDLPFIFSGYAIAAGTSIYPIKILLILVAAVTARASAMSINRIEGLKYDSINPRKREWALVSGKLKLRNAIFLTVALIVIFEVSSFLLNTFVLMLSPVVLFLFITDPMLKKYTEWRHIYMGSVIGVGVLAGYLSVIPAFPASPEIYFLFMASSLWIGGFDMIYVIPDVEYDRKNGLKTVMVRYGIRNGLIISDITHGFAFLFFLLLFIYIRTPYYAAALAIIMYLIIRQHLIVDPERPETIRASFFNSNSFIGFIFLVSVILSIALPLRFPA